MKFRLLLPIVLSLLVSLPLTAIAAWNTNGTPVGCAANNQEVCAIASNGAGGAYLVWCDGRNTSDPNLYIQLVNSSGVPQWAANGIALCTATGTQDLPSIIPGPNGDVFVAWQDFRSGNRDIYAQYVHPYGRMLWTNNGVPVCTVAGEQYAPVIAADGLGGVIIAWQDHRDSNYPNIYAQRLNTSGIAQWTAGGKPLSAVAATQFSPVIVEDQNNGAIVAWQDNRATTYDIYAQRISYEGALEWTATGTVVCAMYETQEAPRIVSDGAAGAIIAWTDRRNPTNVEVYARRIFYQGSAAWVPNGTVIGWGANQQMAPELVADGAGGAIIVYGDFSSGTNFDISAQRANKDGIVQWASGVPVSVCNAPGNQYGAKIVTDGAGGAIVTWFDFRGGTTPDIYAQRINAQGAMLWTTNGVPLCTSTNKQEDPRIIADGTGGAIVAWEDFRADPGYSDIYGTRIGSLGLLPTGVRGATPALGVIVGDNFPNPFSAGTVFDLTLRNEAAVNIEVFDAAGHCVRSLDAGYRSAGPSRLRFDGLDNDAHPLPSGVYFYRVHAGNETVTKKMVIAR